MDPLNDTDIHKQKSQCCMDIYVNMYSITHTNPTTMHYNQICSTHTYRVVHINTQQFINSVTHKCTYKYTYKYTHTHTHTKPKQFQMFLPNWAEDKGRKSQDVKSLNQHHRLCVYSNVYLCKGQYELQRLGMWTFVESQ